jgi:hypothetical protein
MKLFAATLLAAANAQSTVAPDTGVPSWPGRNEKHDEWTIANKCGSVATVNAKIINSTCTVSTNGYPIGFISVAGAFWTGSDTLTGFDGVSEELEQQVLVFWDQDLYAHNDTPDPTKCGGADDILFNCVDNEAPDSTVNLVGNFIFDPRQTSFQVPVANFDLSQTFELPDVNGNNVWAGNLNATGGCVVIDGTVGGCSSPRGDDEACDNALQNCGQLFYFGFDGLPYNTNQK